MSGHLGYIILQSLDHYEIKRHGNTVEFVNVSHLYFYASSSLDITLNMTLLSTKKPRKETFLKPLVDDGINLFNKGFEWQKICGTRILSQVLFFVCSCDSVARDTLQNIKQFNGKHGCRFYFHEDIIAAKGIGHT